MRYNYDTYLLTEDKSKCVMYHSKYDFVIVNDYTPYSIMNDIILTYSEIVMGRDSDRWLETIASKMNFLYINQVWTMVEAPMGITQQAANKNVNLDYCLL